MPIKQLRTVVSATVSLEKYPEDKIIQKKIGGAAVVFVIRGDTLDISSIRVPATKRGQGVASAALKELLDYADNHGLKASLVASSLDKKTSTAKLVEWYQKFGFELTGRKANQLGDPHMIRQLKKVKVTAALTYNEDQPVAIYWGRNEDDKPFYLAGTVTTVADNEITVELNDGSVEVIPKEEWDLVIPLKKPIKSDAELTKADVSKAVDKEALNAKPAKPVEKTDTKVGSVAAKGDDHVDAFWVPAYHQLLALLKEPKKVMFATIKVLGNQHTFAFTASKLDKVSDHDYNRILGHHIRYAVPETGKFSKPTYLLTDVTLGFSKEYIHGERSDGFVCLVSDERVASKDEAAKIEKHLGLLE